MLQFSDHSRKKETFQTIPIKPKKEFLLEDTPSKLSFDLAKVHQVRNVHYQSNEKARYHVQRIGVMTKLPNEEGKNPAKNISRH